MLDISDKKGDRVTCVECKKKDILKAKWGVAKRNKIVRCKMTKCNVYGAEGKRGEVVEEKRWEKERYIGCKR